MGLTLEILVLLQFLATLVAMVARKLKLPYTVGLVIAGTALAFLWITPNFQLTKELLFTVLLPPLIFEAAFYIHWPQLRKDGLVVLIMATLGVLFSLSVITVGMHYLAGWLWQSALLFGALISATDPVSVIAMFKEVAVSFRLKLLVEAESLLNDGTAAVAFAMALAATQGASITASGIVISFFYVVLGGMLCGALVGLGLLLLAGRTDDYLLETAFTIIAAYGSFLLAEHFHFSGVLATLVAGLILGNVKSFGGISQRGREVVESFWEYVAFLVNSLIFLFIGIQLSHQNFSPILKPAGVAVIVVLVARLAAVYPCCLLFARSRWRVSLPEQHVLFWGGLRGALALALALGLPQQLPERSQVISVSFAVVAFSVIVQGLTMKPFLQYLGEADASPKEKRPSRSSQLL